MNNTTPRRTAQSRTAAIDARRTELAIRRAESPAARKIAAARSTNPTDAERRAEARANR